jgi:hypothetical protein
VSKTGALSIEIASSGYGVESDLIPIDGYTNSPYAVEFTWQADNTSTTLILGVEFLDGDGSSIGTTVLAAGSASAALEWETQRGYFAPLETGPPANDARYARLVIAKGAVAGSVYVDNVSVYPAARSCNVSYNTGTLFTTPLPLNGTNIKNIAYNVDTPSPGFYDYGDSVAVDEGVAGGPFDGSYFEIRESGIYEVTATCAFEVAIPLGAPTGALPGDTVPLVMYVYADAEYDHTTGYYLGTGSPRLIATETLNLRTSTISAGFSAQVQAMAKIYTQAHFSYGEKISVAFSTNPDTIAAADLKLPGSTINPIDRYTGIAALTSAYSSLTVKQRLLD